MNFTTFGYRATVPKVFLAKAENRIGPFGLGTLEALKKSAASDPHGRFTLTEDPEASDFILFAEAADLGPFQASVRQNPIFTKFREKCLLYVQSDWFVPLIPGLYCSLKKNLYHSTRTRSVPYIHTRYEQSWPLLMQDSSPTYLFCFQGSVRTHPVRQQIMEFRSPRGRYGDVSDRMLPALIREDPSELESLRHLAIEANRESKFVLCPRGAGAGSIRLFEAMQMGRCPVIISDEWMPLSYVPWHECSIQIRESDVPRIESILSQREHEWQKLGARAREVWETCLSPRHWFHLAAKECEAILQSGKRRERLQPWSAWRDPSTNRMMAKMVLRESKNRLIASRQSPSHQPSDVTSEVREVAPQRHETRI